MRLDLPGHRFDNVRIAPHAGQTGTYRSEHQQAAAQATQSGFDCSEQGDERQLEADQRRRIGDRERQPGREAEFCPEHDGMPENADDTGKNCNNKKTLPALSVAGPPAQGKGCASNYVQKKNCDLRHRIPGADDLIFARANHPTRCSPLEPCLDNTSVGHEPDEGTVREGCAALIAKATVVCE